jgi:hypothetical protein
MKKIDPRKSLERARNKRTFLVEFGDTGQAIRIEVHQREQRHLIDQYIRPSASKSDITDEGAQRFEVVGSYYDLGLALAEYSVDWQGFEGEFDRSLLIEWLAELGGWCERFAQKFKTMLDAHEAELLVYKGEERKN